MIESWRLSIPSFTSFNLEFLGVEVVTIFLGFLMEVGGLVFGLSTLRFEMQLLLLSLGKPFGKQRFLKGWHSLCGQQLMVRSVFWITLCSVAAFWQIVVVCVALMRNLWITC